MPNLEGNSYLYPNFINEFKTTRQVEIVEWSLEGWSEGLAHEILHLFVRERPELVKEIRKVRAEKYGFKHNDSSEHLFVYLGQYYLTGHLQIQKYKEGIKG